MRRLLLIGPAPQNIGGISIHIRRLSGLMMDLYEIDYVDEGHTRYDGVYNLRSGNFFKYLSKIAKADIVHIHSGIWVLRSLHIVICKVVFRKKVIVTIHRDPTIEPHTNLTKWLLKKCDRAILVNQEGFNAMKSEGKCKYFLMPAFLPPNLDNEPQLPFELLRWVGAVKNNVGSYLMCSNAWNLVLHNGEDLYGLDLCIDAMKTLGKNYYLIFVVASNSDQKERMTKYKQEICEYSLDNNILIWESPVSFVRLLQQCDLVLRTTNTDGDAISIRESIYFGIPVLASDVVGRPKEVSLFKNRDVNDLSKKIIELSEIREHQKDNEKFDYRSYYCNIYDN